MPSWSILKERVGKESEKIGKIANQRGSNYYNCPLSSRVGKERIGKVGKKLANLFSFFDSNENDRNGYYFPLVNPPHLRLKEDLVGTRDFLLNGTLYEQNVCETVIIGSIRYHDFLITKKNCVATLSGDLVKIYHIGNLIPIAMNSLGSFFIIKIF